MKKVLLAIALLAATSAVHAAIPLLNATCPGGIEVHADQGGPIYINGKEATLKRFNDNAYEARGGGVTISLTIMPDGSPNVAYTGKGRAHGVCQITSDAAAASRATSTGANAAQNAEMMGVFARPLEAVH